MSSKDIFLSQLDAKSESVRIAIEKLKASVTAWMLNFSERFMEMSP